jgi:hypothetical protein
MGTITTGPEMPCEKTPYGDLGHTLALEYISELCLSLVLAQLDADARRAFVTAALNRVKPQHMKPRTERELAEFETQLAMFETVTAVLQKAVANVNGPEAG